MDELLLGCIYPIIFLEQILTIRINEHPTEIVDVVQYIKGKSCVTQ